MDSTEQTIKFLRNYFDRMDLLLIAASIEKSEPLGGTKTYHAKCRRLKQIFYEAGRKESTNHD